MQFVLLLELMQSLNNTLYCSATLRSSSLARSNMTSSHTTMNRCGLEADEEDFGRLLMQEDKWGQCTVLANIVL